MPHRAIETLLSARRIDVDDQTDLAACAEHHAIPADKIQAIVDVFRPLSDSLEIFVTT